MTDSDEYFMLGHSYMKKCRILDRSRKYRPEVEGESWFMGVPFKAKVKGALKARLRPFDPNHPDMSQRLSSFMGRSGMPIFRNDLIEVMQDWC